MFSVSQIVKLANAGFTEQEIEELIAPKDTNGNEPEPKPEPEPKQEPEPKPEPEPNTENNQQPVNNNPVDFNKISEDINKVITSSFEELTKALVKSSIAGSQQPEKQSGDDILANIIAPPLIDNNKRG